jgi:uncharacterized protein
MLAAAGGHIDVVNLLLANGAKANVRNNRRETASEIAVASGHTAVAALLRR